MLEDGKGLTSGHGPGPDMGCPWVRHAVLRAVMTAGRARRIRTVGPSGCS